MKTLKRKTNAGFTLIEIMLVIIIIVALMAVLLPAMMTKMKQVKIDQAVIYMTTLAGDIAQYDMRNGSPPTTNQGLKALVEMPQGEPRPRRWSQFETEIRLDPWNNEYRYEFPGKRSKTGFDLYSCGPDLQPDTADDIVFESR